MTKTKIMLNIRQIFKDKKQFLIAIVALLVLACFIIYCVVSFQTKDDNLYKMLDNPEQTDVLTIEEIAEQTGRTAEDVIPEPTGVSPFDELLSPKPTNVPPLE